jgi:hypothetical protein
VTDRTKANRRGDCVLPPENHDPSNYVALSPEHKRSPHEDRRSRENLSLNDAIDALVAEMVRAEPDLFREDAREAIRQTVHDLLRDAGKVN